MAHKQAYIRLYGSTYDCDVVTDGNGEKRLQVFALKEDSPFIQPDRHILSATIHKGRVEVLYADYVSNAVLHSLIRRIEADLEPGLCLITFAPFEVRKLLYPVSSFDLASGILEFAGKKYVCKYAYKTTENYATYNYAYKIRENDTEGWLDIRTPGFLSLEIARAKISGDTLTVTWSELPFVQLRSILNIFVNLLQIPVRTIAFESLVIPALNVGMTAEILP